MFCRKCGTENSETASFCLRCGAKLAGPQTSWWEDRRVRLALVILATVILISTAAIVISTVLRPVQLLTPEPLPASSTAPASATRVASSENEPEDTPSALPDVLGTSNLYLEYILDASGSMNDPLPDGSIKLEVARDLLSDHLQAFRPETNIGLRAYGHRVDYRQTAESCQDIELIAPVEQGQLETIVTWLGQFQAQGMTPLAESIRIAMEDFAFEPGRINAIVMISDGEETCDGDPCGLVEELKAQGINFTIHVIGLDVDEATREQLSCITGAAGGTYHDAGSAKDLEAALGSIQHEVSQSERVVPGGTVTPTTPPISTDTPTPIPTMPASTPSATPTTATSEHQDLISYLDQDGSLWLFDPGNGLSTRLETAGEPRVSGYVWSPDGRQIAYVNTWRDSPGSDVYALDIVTGDNRLLLSSTSTGFPIYGELAWSPSGDRIALHTSSGIRLLDLLTGEMSEAVAPACPGIGTRSPAKTVNLNWSPDGSSLAYHHCTEGAMIVAASAPPTVLLDASSMGAGRFARPLFSPDGSSIAWTAGENFATTLVLTDIQGRAYAQYSTSPCSSTTYGVTTAWSPNGNAIAIAGEGGLCVLDIETGNLDKYTAGQGAWNPSWSPDGRQIAFSFAETVWDDLMRVEFLYEKTLGILDLGTAEIRDLGFFAARPLWRPGGELP